MARAMLCDRCDDFEEGEPIAKVEITVQPSADAREISRRWELCSRCLAHLKDFLDDRRIDPKAHEEGA